MALRLNKSIVKGEINNSVPGRVTGKLWLLGLARPVELDLVGNARRDIAGCQIKFENTSPEPQGSTRFLRRVQKGKVGECTASRKVKVLDCSLDKARELRADEQPVPIKLSNALYLEWFSDADGRVVVESTEFIINALGDEPTWRMDSDQDTLQKNENRLTIREYIRKKDEELEEAWDDADDDDVFSRMDEFEWEKELKESEARTDKYSELLETYWEHPERDRIIAREMGWEWLDDALDAEQRGAFEEGRMEYEDVPDLDPNPATEGKDWIRTDEGDIRHPLAHRAFGHSMWMWHYCDDRKLLKEGTPEVIHEMVFEAQTLSAKLAGALNGLCFREEPDGGFVVACLKRALKFLERSLAASEKVLKLKLLDKKSVDEFRGGLFEIREKMLHLMKYYRSLDSSR